MAIDNKKAASNKAKWLYPLGLIIFLLAVLLFVEYSRPYFFFQDDNRDFYLPFVMHNYKSLANGEFAFYNFFQSLGTPSFSNGQSQVFYPLPYITTFLSKILLGHHHGTIDILVIIHLLIGALGTYALVKQVTGSPLAAVFAGFTWPLSSFVMFVSNSWMIVSAVAAYLPWMVHLSILSYKKPDFRLKALAVAVRLLLFYSGHIQFFVYAVIFEFITVMLYIQTVSDPKTRKEHTIKYFKQYVFEYITVFFFAAPLLFPLWHQTSISFQRAGAYTFKEFTEVAFGFPDMLVGLFWPFMQIDMTYDNSWRNTINLGHIGYAPLIILLGAVFSKYIHRKHNLKSTKTIYLVFMIPAIFAMLWASSVVILGIIYLIPVINRFRWPFKLALYMDFYFIVLSAVILAEWLKKIKPRKAIRNFIFLGLISLQLISFIILYTVTPHKSFGENHLDQVPLEDELAETLENGRVIPIDFCVWTPTIYNDKDSYTLPTYGFNYGTLLEVDCFNGYDMMMSENTQIATAGLNFKGYYYSDSGIPINYFRRAGVKYYMTPGQPQNNIDEILTSFGLEQIYSDEHRILYYDKAAVPMVFLSEGGEVPYENTSRSTNTVSAEVSIQKDDNLIFNYFYNPFFKAYIDGKETSAAKSQYFYTLVKVPAGSHTVTIKYENPYFKAGLMVMLVYGVLLAGFLYLISKIKKRTAKVHNNV